MFWEETDSRNYTYELSKYASEVCSSQKMQRNTVHMRMGGGRDLSTVKDESTWQMSVKALKGFQHPAY